MMTKRLNLGTAVLAAALVLVHRPSLAQQPSLCDPAIAAAERAEALPPGLLRAIALVESGRPDPDSGTVVPWPWTIDASGDGRMFDTKDQAVAAVQALRSKGSASIDAGCMQVNLLQHPDAFPTLDQAFDPAANAAYAARFLRALFQETGDWARATGAYHSRTPELAGSYVQRVLAVWRGGGAVATVAYRAFAQSARTAYPFPLRPFAPPPLLGFSSAGSGQDGGGYALPTGWRPLSRSVARRIAALANGRGGPPAL